MKVSIINESISSLTVKKQTAEQLRDMFAASIHKETFIAPKEQKMVNKIKVSTGSPSLVSTPLYLRIFHKAKPE